MVYHGWPDKRKIIMINKKKCTSILASPDNYFIHFGIILFLLLAFTSACKSDKTEIKTESEYTEEKPSLSLIFPEPVTRDFDAIKRDGTIRMITRFNSSAYFLHRGEEKGFEYELGKAFADKHNLALQVIVSPENEHPIDLLNSGRGDFIAANYTITPERQQYLRFSAPYNVVNQILVFRSDDEIPETLEDLDGLKISVREGSAYFKTLKRLKKKGYNFSIDTLPEIWDTEAILFALRDGDFQATVADDNLFHSASIFIDGLTEGPIVSHLDEIAWGIRSNATELEKALNDFITPHFRISEADQMPRRSTFMNVLTRRYFDNRPVFYNVRNYALGTGFEGILSPYDNLVKPLAEEAGIDWKLVIAVMAQESRFDPFAESWMGAMGLMQIMPRFSNVDYDYELFNPEINVREGLRFLRKHMRHYAYLDSVNQLAFSLAAYNVGMGHLADARRLTIDRNRNPNDWEHVSESLLMLMQPHHYRNARHGYARGIETVNYVRQIMNRHQMYHSLMMFADEDPLKDRLEHIISMDHVRLHE
jgi:membrane-bound lytic murein transglycosylase F